MEEKVREIFYHEQIYSSMKWHGTMEWGVVKIHITKGLKSMVEDVSDVLAVIGKENDWS